MGGGGWVMFVSFTFQDPYTHYSCANLQCCFAAGGDVANIAVEAFLFGRGGMKHTITWCGRGGMKHTITWCGRLWLLILFVTVRLMHRYIPIYNFLAQNTFDNYRYFTDCVETKKALVLNWQFRSSLDYGEGERRLMKTVDRTVLLHWLLGQNYVKTPLHTFRCGGQGFTSVRKRG